MNKTDKHEIEEILRQERPFHALQVEANQGALYLELVYAGPLAFVRLPGLEPFSGPNLGALDQHTLDRVWIERVSILTLKQAIAPMALIRHEARRLAGEVRRDVEAFVLQLEGIRA